jgi:leader peptidase (prepilin peptidase)/N-methyltransferase
MDTLFLILVFGFGAIIGSFLNVVILRLPKDETLEGRSHCNSCGHNLRALDLVPIFSYVFLGGKCRYCGHKISPRYFFIELITGVLFALAYSMLNPALDIYGALTTLKWWLLICVCIITFVVDFEHFIILFYAIVPPAIFVGLLNIFLDINMHRSLLGLTSTFASGILGMLAGFLFFGLFWYASKWKTGKTGQWMGFGDVELSACLGMMLGWPLIGVSIFIAVILGGAVSVFLLAFKGKTFKSMVPFGTFFSFSAVLSLFYGERLLHWYLALLGF